MLVVGSAAAAASHIDPRVLGEEETAVGAPPDTVRDMPLLLPRATSPGAAPVPKPPAPVPSTPAMPSVPSVPSVPAATAMPTMPALTMTTATRGRISLLRAALWLLGLLAVGIGAGILIAELAA